MFIQYYYRFRALYDERALNSTSGLLMVGMWVQRFIDSLFWRLGNKKIVECYGDSHINIFGRINGCVGSLRFVVNSVRGATALGITNPNSKTNAMVIFSSLLKRSSSARYLMFCLGEVDCGFLIWLVSQTRGTSHEELFNRAVKSYVDFIGRHCQGRKVVVLSAPLPTIPDHAQMGTVANLRKEVTATQKQRTDLTLNFNRDVKAWCDAKGIGFIDLDQIAVDPETGLVARYLLNADPRDHHYSQDAFAKLLESSQLAAFYD